MGSDADAGVNELSEYERAEQRAENAVDTLIEYLDGKLEAYNVRTHKHTVDFTIGNPELWPNSLNDDELNVISSSSIDFGGWTMDEKGLASKGADRTGANIHLPPAKESLFDELTEKADFPEKFKMVNGTFVFGSFINPGDDVCRPHLFILEDATVEEVILALDEVFRLYREVYDYGEKIIKKDPETNDTKNTKPDQ